jgi:hypothetical protein
MEWIHGRITGSQAALSSPRRGWPSCVRFATGCVYRLLGRERQEFATFELLVKGPQEARIRGMVSTATNKWSPEGYELGGVL